jgi:hypothetical protein
MGSLYFSWDTSVRKRGVLSSGKRPWSAYKSEGNAAMVGEKLFCTKHQFARRIVSKLNSSWMGFDL